MACWIPSINNRAKLKVLRGTRAIRTAPTTPILYHTTSQFQRGSPKVFEKKIQFPDFNAESQSRRARRVGSLRERVIEQQVLGSERNSGEAAYWDNGHLARCLTIYTSQVAAALRKARPNHGLQIFFINVTNSSFEASIAFTKSTPSLSLSSLLGILINTT